jgi:general nucleoside transport system ATP-binding protein
MTFALQAVAITKRYPGVLANDQVDFSLRKGEIHALLGENGAGKSTLMNILYGLSQPDSGEILVNGIPTRLSSPHDAISHGIGMVHQHFMLVPPMTVAENVMLGQEKVIGATRPLGKLALLDPRSVRNRIHELTEPYGLEVDPDARVQNLSVGQQQRVEILKVLYRQVDIFILDEPTAVLTPQEADDLFVVMRTMVFQGKSIIFITHKIHDVFNVADRISVMRSGQMVGTITPADATREKLAEMMVGRQVSLKTEKVYKKPGRKVLDVLNLFVEDANRHQAVSGLSLQVYAGEVLGIAGVQGNGQSELIEALTGLRQPIAGKVKIMGKDTTHSSPRQLYQAGVRHIPENRHKHGLVLSFTIIDNLMLSSYHKAPFSEGMKLNYHELRRKALELIQTFDIRTPTPDTIARSLSGGNQQRVIIARELSEMSALLIANQPTRGLDISSLQEIHQRLLVARQDGAAVLLVSADLDEILSLSDRIAVMSRGQIVAELDPQSTSRKELGMLMAGDGSPKYG